MRVVIAVVGGVIDGGGGEVVGGSLVGRKSTSEYVGGEYGYVVEWTSLLLFGGKRGGSEGVY